MKTVLKLREHEISPGANVVELWFDGEFIGAVYGMEGAGVRIVTKHEMAAHVGGIAALTPAGVVEITIAVER